MLDSLTDVVSSSVWTYPVVAGVVALDGFCPVVPGETVVITAAVAAAGGDLVVWLVLVCALAGAFAGDNASYWLGTKLGRVAARRLFTGERSTRTLGWARRQLRDRGRRCADRGGRAPREPGGGRATGGLSDPLPASRARSSGSFRGRWRVAS